MDEKAKLKVILGKLSEADRVWNQWKPVWEEIIDFINPRRVKIDLTSITEGEKNTAEIFDSTALNASRLYANGMFGNLCSMSSKWMSPYIPMRKYVAHELIIKYKSVNNIPEVRMWLDDIEEHLYSVFRRGNFYPNMVEFLYDGGTFGTGVMYCEEDMVRNTTRFSTRPLGEIRILDNEFGEVDTVFRKFKLSRRNLIHKFGVEAFDEQFRRKANTGAEEMMDVTHAVFRNADYDLSKYSSKNMKFASVYIVDGKIVSEKGYNTNPFAVWRLGKNTFETYGRGPGIEALSDVKRKNSINKDELIVSQMAAFPPYNVPAELRGQVRITPKGMNYYDDHQRVITPINTALNWPIVQEAKDDIKKMIEDHFNVPLFLMLERAERMMTATEILERQGEKAAVLGTEVGKLISEVFDPIIDRTFDIEYRAGRLPPPPDILMELGVKNIEIDYLGPLATAQKNSQERRAIDASILSAAPVLQLFPESADVIDADELVRRIFAVNGNSQAVFRSEEELGARRQQRQQQQQGMEALDAAEVALKGMKGAAKAPEAGSPMEMLMEGMGGQ